MLLLLLLLLHERGAFKPCLLTRITPHARRTHAHAVVQALQAHSHLMVNAMRGNEQRATDLLERLNMLVAPPPAPLFTQRGGGAGGAGAAAAAGGGPPDELAGIELPNIERMLLQVGRMAWAVAWRHWSKQS
jgi:hypothetical protein